jgi:argininosuccinate lyase
VAQEQAITLDKLSLEDLQAISPIFEPDVRSIFDFRSSVESRSAIGGTAPQAVQRQLGAAKKLIFNCASNLDASLIR